MTLVDDTTLPPLHRWGIDAAGNLTAALPCRQCGYDLHGLHESGRCPECGVPVGVSLRGDLLRFSQPQWVASLRLGVKLILWSIVVSIAGVVLTVILGMFDHGHFSQPAMMLVVSAGGIISFIGSWHLTMPDPSGVGEDQYGTSRKIIRIGLAVSLSNYAINFVKSGITLPAVSAMMVEGLTIAIESFGLIASFALMNYLSKLATRIPDPKLTARAKFLMYAMCGSQLVGLVFGHVIQRLLLPKMVAGAGQTMLLFSLVSAVVGICSLVFGVMYLFMLLGFNKRFKEAAASARLIWQASPV